MYMFIFKFSPNLFVFVYSGAKLQHLNQKDIAICNTNVRKCNLYKI